MSTSGLAPIEKIKARDLAMQAAALGLHNSAQVHYTQGPQRWEGIAGQAKAWRGQYPKHADCSAFVTWCLWNGLDHFHVGDVVNGEEWRAGYTGTLLDNGVSVVHAGNFQRGDVVLYGAGAPGEHTALYVGGGKVISHGSEAGPFLLDMHYRPDFLDLRRYI